VNQHQAIGTVDVTEAARRMTSSPDEPLVRGAPAADTAGPAARSRESVAPSPLLVDVREVNEFRQLRVPGAVLVPLSDFATSHVRLPKDRPLLVMCASGKRSLVAAEFLSRNGYPDVANVEGGIIAWHGAGLPTTDGPPAPGEGDLPAG
jgi:rhodanese-related sulfurtransferase